MNVFFAPDYREGVPYQSLLADALAAQGVTVTFPRGHRRILPLSRGLHGWSGDVLHIHWPEKFFEIRRDGLDFWRKVRFPLDLALAARKVPIVLTAHDLRPHNRAGESLLHSNFERTYAAARAIIAHSANAASAIAATYRVDPSKIHVIPHGDLSPSLGQLPGRAQSRAELAATFHLPAAQPICLMYGTVEPYKGIEPVIDHWRTANPAVTLAIVGKPFSADYATAIRDRAGSAPNILLDLAWQPDASLKRWLAAADCVLFNYRAIFTSGAACLARSLGIPILLPIRLDTVDLAEPDNSVHRFTDFDADFSRSLKNALSAPPDFGAAAKWRELTAWPRIATQTAHIYSSISTPLA